MRRPTPSPAAPQASAMARTLRLARQSGALNLSNRELRAFPTEIFRLYEDLDEDERSWECASLVNLDLSYNEIETIPDQIESLKYLLKFKMRHNRLQKLPNCFWNLETLTSLDLSNNQLEGRLPQQLGTLNKLRELGLEGNKLTELPESIGDLRHLEILKVDSNQLRTLPSTIGNLGELKTLSAHSNQIAELPVSFGSLTSLLTVDFKKNWLRSTENAFVALASVTYIDLRENRLEVFPVLPENNTCLDQLFLGFNAIQQIPEDVVLSVKESLTVLDVRDNKLQRLSDRFPQLYRLKTLDFTNNDLHDLPAGLGYLKYLNHLLVEGNPLRSIRSSIISSGTEPLKKYLRTRGGPPIGVDVMDEEMDEFAISQGRVEQDDPMDGEATSKDEYLFRDAAASGALQLAEMKLQQLPSQLRGAGKYRFKETLLQLNLSKNQLLELPMAIGELTSLTTLIAEQCGLKMIDSSIAMIPSLQCLRLRKNSLTTDIIDALFVAGSSAGACSSLKELDLRNNLLTDVPQQLQCLAAMDTLLLSFNRIQTLDTFPWSSMQQLSVLSVSDNRVESLGTVYQAPMLASLSLENNELRKIPAELALCENLRAIYLAGNPQRGIRAHILSGGTDAILKYLRNRLPPDVLPPTISKKTQESFETTGLPPLSNQNTEAGMHQRGTVQDPKRPRVDVSTPTTKHLGVNPDPRPTNLHNDSTALRQPPPEPQPEPAVPDGSVKDDVLEELEAKIARLEQQLDDFAITAAKRFALKKDLAMTRSLKIRHLRKIGLKP
ncbi:hypothetical protein PHYBOEH_003553 [Phytophthora boehmeriae]|uniref:Disease resistance R13L4/SHOC-2-like LRR domain-containing protein n=1 Tax=Phytophthora boehmeriae TaxID=109152 RepID=A0A8T1XAA2_9STRA|nr:hypothetical protein PHYBOEH_003553 [Phytophthora boehmeriae]